MLVKHTHVMEVVGIGFVAHVALHLDLGTQARHALAPDGPSSLEAFGWVSLRASVLQHLHSPALSIERNGVEVHPSISFIAQNEFRRPCVFVQGVS